MLRLGSGTPVRSQTHLTCTPVRQASWAAAVPQALASSLGPASAWSTGAPRAALNLWGSREKCPPPASLSSGSPTQVCSPWILRGPQQDCASVVHTVTSSFGNCHGVLPLLPQCPHPTGASWYRLPGKPPTYQSWSQVSLWWTVVKIRTTWHLRDGTTDISIGVSGVLPPQHPNFSLLSPQGPWCY